jgi:hypothetical protein
VRPTNNSGLPSSHSARSRLDSPVGWAFLPVETLSDKNVQPTTYGLATHRLLKQHSRSTLKSPVGRGRQTCLSGFGAGQGCQKSSERS